MESHAGYVHAALQQALAKKELGQAEIERALLAISDEEMQQVERLICRRLVAECHDLLFALNGQLPPAQEVFRSAGIDPQTMERCYWLTPDPGQRNAIPAYRAYNSFVNALTGEWLQLAP